jgi:hypothetical protein
MPAGPRGAVNAQRHITRDEQAQRSSEGCARYGMKGRHEMMTQQQVQQRKGCTSKGKRIRRRTRDQQDPPTTNRKIARLWFQLNGQ